MDRLSLRPSSDIDVFDAGKADGTVTRVVMGILLLARLVPSSSLLVVECLHFLLCLLVY